MRQILKHKCLEKYTVQDHTVQYICKPGKCYSTLKKNLHCYID